MKHIFCASFLILGTFFASNFVNSTKTQTNTNLFLNFIYCVFLTFLN